VLSHRTGARPRWLLPAGLLGAGVLGACLRCYRIDSQVVFGDEVHSIYRLLHESYAELAGRFYEHDHCIPLSLLLKRLADSVGLDEVTLRLPSLLGGVVLVVIGPLLAAPFIGRRAAFLFGLLLAISPDLVYFSRYARPYMIATLLVFIAVFALLRWTRTQERSFAILYAACAVLAIWFHLLTAPAVLTPLAVVGLATLRVGDAALRRARVRTLLGVAAGLGSGLALLLAIPFWSSLDVLFDKTGRVWPTGLTVYAVLTSIPGFVQTPGSPGRALVWVFWAGVAVGALLLVRRASLVVLVLLATSVAQVAAVVLLAPDLVHFYDTFLRYVSWLIPFVLLFLSVALSAAAAPLERLGLGRAAGVVAVALGAGVVLLLFQLGTWRCVYATGSNFPTKSSHLAACRWGRAPGDWSYPAVYDFLAGVPGSFGVVETPWFDWWEDRYQHYQEVHRKELFIGFAPLADGRYGVPHFDPARPALRFGRFVDLLDAARLEERAVRYVLFHKDLPREMHYTTDLFDSRSDVGTTIDLYRRLYGAPTFEDQHVVMFDVRRNRNRPSEADP
jgi:hypothetical protein